MLSGSTRLAGILGWPVAHSRSPLLHGAWLARHGIDGAYVPLPVRPAEFSRAITGLAACGFVGVNVTIPHKLAALELCDALDPSARRAGAVNTLVFGEQIVGSNTDGWGFLESLRACDIEVAGAPVLLLGAGGASRAIAAALLDAGARVSLANRGIARAQALGRDLPGLAVLPWERRADALADMALLVNTTSLGMHGQPPLDLSLDRACASLAVADIVYAPLRTPLLSEAQARGLRTVDGLGMLMHQARAGFRAWFGVLPEADRAIRDMLAADLSR